MGYPIKHKKAKVNKITSFFTIWNPSDQSNLKSHITIHHRMDIRRHSTKFARCFQLLYIDMKIGRDIIPLERLTFFIGLHISRVPLEVNQAIAPYLFTNFFNISNHGMILFEEFIHRHPILFKHYLEKLWIILKMQIESDGQQLSFFQLIEGITAPQHFWETNHNLSCIRRIALSLVRITEDEEDLYSIIRWNAGRRDVIMAILAKKGCLLQYVRVEDEDDVTAMTAVKNDGCSLYYARPEHKRNEDIVLAAIQNNAHAIKYADSSLRDNSAFVLKALMCIGSSYNTTFFNQIHPQFRDDYEIMFVAVQLHGHYLTDASKRLRDDDTIVRIAITNHGSLLYASKRLQTDYAIVLSAVEVDGNALHYASECLRDNEEIVRKAVQNNGVALMYASERIKDNESIVRIAIAHDITHLNFASSRLKQNDDMYFR